MNAKKFSDAMSELDTKYVDEALNHKKKAKRPGWIKWGAMAACLCRLVTQLLAKALIRIRREDSLDRDSAAKAFIGMAMAWNSILKVAIWALRV